MTVQSWLGRGSELFTLDELAHIHSLLASEVGHRYYTITLGYCDVRIGVRSQVASAQFCPTHSIYTAIHA